MENITGIVAFNLGLAGVLTLILGAVTLVLMQRAILRNMSAGPALAPAPRPERPRRAADEPLALIVDNAPTDSSGPADRALRRMVIAHAASGLVFAILAGAAYLSMNGMEFLPVRTAVVIWAYGWPTVLVLSLLVGPDRDLQFMILFGYFGGLVVLGTVAWLQHTPDLEMAGMTLPGFFQPLVLWAVSALPSLFLLLFLNRTVRAIGPLVLVFVFVLLLGGQVAHGVLALPGALESLPVTVALHALGGNGVFWGTYVLGMLVAAWPAWRIVAVLRDRYATKRSSEFLFTAGVIWLLESMVLASGLSFSYGLLAAAVGLVPWLAWRFTLYLLLRPALSAARRRPPTRLLLLRVFGFGSRSRRLLDLLGARWRLIGSIDLIAAPDLASRTVEPWTFIEFIRGRLTRLFIRTPQQLDERLAALDERPDPDARFRVNQLFCGDSMWRDAVTRLMSEATLVVMDLRGFGAHRRGCVYEIETLLDTVPLQRLVFLFDRTTDRPALKQLLLDHWQKLDVESPNVTLRKPTLRLMHASGGDTQAVRRLLAVAEAPARATIERLQ